jgi:hypothetical protein
MLGYLSPATALELVAEKRFLDSVCMGTLSAVVGENGGVGHCLLGYGRTVGLDDLGTRAQGRADVDGLKGTEGWRPMRR